MNKNSHETMMVYGYGGMVPAKPAEARRFLKALNKDNIEARDYFRRQARLLERQAGFEDPDEAQQKITLLNTKAMMCRALADNVMPLLIDYVPDAEPLDPAEPNSRAQIIRNWLNKNGPPLPREDELASGGEMYERAAQIPGYYPRPIAREIDADHRAKIAGHIKGKNLVCLFYGEGGHDLDRLIAAAQDGAIPHTIYVHDAVASSLMDYALPTLRKLFPRVNIIPIVGNAHDKSFWEKDIFPELWESPVPSVWTVDLTPSNFTYTLNRIFWEKVAATAQPGSTILAWTDYTDHEETKKGAYVDPVVNQKLIRGTIHGLSAIGWDVDPTVVCARTTIVPRGIVPEISMSRDQTFTKRLRGGKTITYTWPAGEWMPYERVNKYEEGPHRNILEYAGFELVDKMLRKNSGGEFPNANMQLLELRVPEKPHPKSHVVNSKSPRS